MHIRKEEERKQMMNTRPIDKNEGGRRVKIWQHDLYTTSRGRIKTTLEKQRASMSLHDEYQSRQCWYATSITPKTELSTSIMPQK